VRALRIELIYKADEAGVADDRERSNSADRHFCGRRHGEE